MLLVAEIWTEIEMAETVQSGQKGIIRCGPSSKNQKHWREMEKNRKIYSKYEKYM